MVVDTSALLAIFFAEPERTQFLKLIAQAETRLISAVIAFETAIVLEARRGQAAGREFDFFLDRAGFDIVSVDAEQIQIARAAWRRFGKGRHSAALNFGDCFSYALAKASGEPLLAKGGDFAQTDLETCEA